MPRSLLLLCCVSLALAGCPRQRQVQVAPDRHHDGAAPDGVYPDDLDNAPVEDHGWPTRVDTGVPTRSARWGRAGAPLVIDVFTDYQCPFCRRLDPVLAEIAERWGPAVQIRLRDYPIAYHQQARPAAMAVRCAEEQGAHHALHDYLMAPDTQLEAEPWLGWGDQRLPDPVAFRACLLEERHGEWIDHDREAGVRAQVAGVPTVFVNGRPSAGSPEAIEALLEQEVVATIGRVEESPVRPSLPPYIISLAVLDSLLPEGSIDHARLEAGGPGWLQARTRLDTARQNRLVELLRIALLLRDHPDPQSAMRAIPVALAQLMPPQDHASLQDWFLADPDLSGPCSPGQPTQAAPFCAAENTYLAELRDAHGVWTRLPTTRVPVDEGDLPAFGSADAPVTVVEFADYNCVYCERLGQARTAHEAQFPGQVRWLHRDMPLSRTPDHFPHAARCVAEQDPALFWPFHDRLQNIRDASNEQLAELLTELGGRARPFLACQEEGRHLAAIQRDREAASAIGVTGTPTFFINGRPVTGYRGLDALRALIREELAR